MGVCTTSAGFSEVINDGMMAKRSELGLFFVILHAVLLLCNYTQHGFTSRMTFKYTFVKSDSIVSQHRHTEFRVQSLAEGHFNAQDKKSLAPDGQA